jgi:hypothetical protein
MGLMTPRLGKEIMKTSSQTNGRFGRSIIGFVALQFALDCFLPVFARPRPPIPPLPEAGVLRQFRFDEAGAWYPLRGAPLEAVNVAFAESWSGYALQVGGLPPALLRFPMVESDGHTNLNCQVGSVRFWFRPLAWSSQGDGGQGPGTWARLLEVGAFTDNARFGWWSVHVSPEGEKLHFRAQGDGRETEFLRAPILWSFGEWHDINPRISQKFLESVVGNRQSRRAVEIGSKDITDNKFLFRKGGELTNCGGKFIAEKVPTADTIARLYCQGHNEAKNFGNIGFNGGENT